MSSRWKYPLRKTLLVCAKIIHNGTSQGTIMPKTKRNEGNNTAEEAPIFLNQNQFVDKLNSTRANKPFYLVVLVDDTEELAKSLYRRLSQDTRRTVAAIKWETFEEIKEEELNFPDNVTLYLTAHGNINCMGEFTGEALGREILPFLERNEEIGDVKLASCHSGEKIDLTQVHNQNIKERLQAAKFDKSMAEKVSAELGEHPVNVHGYIGAHSEHRKNRENHSFVDVGKQTLRASEARVTFREGEKIREPFPALKQQNKMEFQDSETGEETQFKLGY